MSYQTIPMYVVTCDQCHTEHEDDEYAGWASKDQADERAEADDWTATRGRHLCPDCAQLVVQDPEDVIAARHSEPGPNDPTLPIEPKDGA